MRVLTQLAGAAGICLMLTSVQAASVVCPGSLGADGSGITVTRQIEVTGALTGGECYYKLGNFQGDDVSDFLGSSYTLIDKDIAPNGGDGGYLLYTGSTSGTWDMSVNLWGNYNEIFLGFHFGNGKGDPDSFLVELDPGTRSVATSGDWALIPSNLANGLSNIYLFGRGTPDNPPPPPPPPEEIPEPGSLALLALGLLGAAVARRRRV